MMNFDKKNMMNSSRRFFEIVLFPMICYANVIGNQVISSNSYFGLSRSHFSMIFRWFFHKNTQKSLKSIWVNRPSINFFLMNSKICKNFFFFSSSKKNFFWRLVHRAYFLSFGRSENPGRWWPYRPFEI